MVVAVDPMSTSDRYLCMKVRSQNKVSAFAEQIKLKMKECEQDVTVYVRG